MVTIRDVAKKANVSISTVSAALNNTKHVSPQLKAHILAAVEELNYRPNRVAQALNRRKTHTIAYVTPDIANPSFVRALKGVMKAAKEHDYSVMVLDTEGDAKLAQRYFRDLFDLRVDGAAVNLTWDIVNDENLRMISDHQARLPLVGVSGARIIPDVDCFVWDEEEGGYQLARYLLRLGHRQVLFAAPTPSAAAEQRFRGIQRAFKEEDTPFTEECRIEVDGYNTKSGYKGILGALGRAIEFSAVISFNDKITSGIITGLARQGLRIPEDVSVVTFGNGHVGLQMDPITSMTFNDRMLGYDAGKRLIELIESTSELKPSIHRRKLELSVQPSSGVARATKEALR